MTIRATFWTLLLAALLLTWVSSPASAGFDAWRFGTGFHVGGIDFRIGYAEAGRFGSSFYFEAARPFSYRGYACSSYCYRQGPRYYHHPSCLAVLHHFGIHGYSADYYLQHYRPPVVYSPPAYYYPYPSPRAHYGPPGWSVRFYGHHDQYRYDRDRHDWNRHDWDRHDRYRHDRDRHDRDRHNRGGVDRDRRDR